MIRRPLTSVGLKQSDIEHMEACLQRKFKNPEPNENEASPNLQRGVILETPVRMSTRSAPNNSATMSEGAVSPNVPVQDEMATPNETGNNPN